MMAAASSGSSSPRAPLKIISVASSSSPERISQATRPFRTTVPGGRKQGGWGEDLDERLKILLVLAYRVRQLSRLLMIRDEHSIRYRVGFPLVCRA